MITNFVEVMPVEAFITFLKTIQPEDKILKLVTSILKDTKYREILIERAKEGVRSCHFYDTLSESEYCDITRTLEKYGLSCKVEKDWGREPEDDLIFRIYICW